MFTMRINRFGALALRAWAMVLAVLWLGAGFAHAQGEADATLRWLNRDIVTLRAPLAGVTPQVRVHRALARLEALDATQIDAALRTLPFVLGEDKGLQVLVGDQLVFSLMAADLDPEQQVKDLDAAAAQAMARLQLARIAWHQTRDQRQLWMGVARVAGVLAVVALLLWGLARWARWTVAVLERRRHSLAQQHESVNWRELADRLFARLVHLVQWGASAVVLYLGVEGVLASFAISAPLATRWHDWLVEKLWWVADGVVSGVPGVLTVVLVILVTRAFTDVLGYFFDAVRAGRLQIPLLHPDTVTATRRIVIALVWLLGAGIAYPYLPGAGSEAFKGLSVMAGLMITLGATGIVTQATSGILLIYARALRKGDYVQVGDVEGVVSDVAPLATKVLNLRNEEITIPNAVLISSPIHNYSRLAESQGTLVSTHVTIGYDAPWRTVHALLEQAAAATAGLRHQPPPRVFQRALSDFYVDYELLVSLDRPIDRLPILSALHANIQDAFNAAGVQIMSPHFMTQPDQPVLSVPPAAR